MSSRPITRPDISARGAARLAGICYAAIFVLAIYANFAVRMRLVDPSDAAATTQNLAQSDGQVRLAVAAFTIVFLLDIAIAWALYVVFRPYGPQRALLAAWFRLGYTILLGAACVFLFLALRLATSSTFADGFGPDADAAAVLLTLEAFDYLWLIGLAAFGIHLVLIGRIIVTARPAPVLLGWILIVSGGAYLVDTFAHVLLADYSTFAPMFLVMVALPSICGELWFTLWLMIRAGRDGNARPAANRPGSPHRDRRRPNLSQEDVRT